MILSPSSVLTLLILSLQPENGGSSEKCKFLFYFVDILFWICWELTTYVDSEAFVSNNYKGCGWWSRNCPSESGEAARSYHQGRWHTCFRCILGVLPSHSSFSLLRSDWISKIRWSIINHSWARKDSAQNTQQFVISISAKRPCLHLMVLRLWVTSDLCTCNLSVQLQMQGADKHFSNNH